MASHEPESVDQAEVEQIIAALTNLADEPFAESLADTIMDPDAPEAAVERAAFRSEQLAYRSLVAARYLIDHVNTRIRHIEGESASSRRRSAEQFRNKVGMERRLLEAIVAGIRARSGKLPAQPNPRARALRRLATENLAGDVPKGRFRDLIEEEKQADIDRRAREREERKQARREAKARERAAAGRG